MSIAEKLQTIADNLQLVYEAGYNANSGGGANPFEYVKILNNLYQNLTLPDGYEVTLDLPIIEQVQGTFRNAKGFAKVKLTCNEGQLVNMWNCFSYCSAKTVDLTEFRGKISSLSNAFMAASIVDILGELDLSACTDTTSVFSVAWDLTEIRIKEGTLNVGIAFTNCQKLSDASIQSIIDGLADLTGATAQTLTFHATVGTKLTQAQKDAISAKNWTLAY